MWGNHYVVLRIKGSIRNTLAEKCNEYLPSDPVGARSCLDALTFRDRLVDSDDTRTGVGGRLGWRPLSFGQFRYLTSLSGLPERGYECPLLGQSGQMRFSKRDRFSAIDPTRILS